MHVVLKVLKSKKLLGVELVEHSLADEARTSFLFKAITDAVGKPEADGYDGIYLLKAAIAVADGIVCTDPKPRWRDLDRPLPAEKGADDESEDGSEDGSESSVNEILNSPFGQSLTAMIQQMQMLSGSLGATGTPTNNDNDNLPPLVPATESATSAQNDDENTTQQSPAYSSIPTPAAAQPSTAPTNPTPQAPNANANASGNNNSAFITGPYAMPPMGPGFGNTFLTLGFGGMPAPPPATTNVTPDTATATTTSTDDASEPGAPPNTPAAQAGANPQANGPPPPMPGGVSNMPPLQGCAPQ
jgi:hypothetical protein